MSDSEQQKMENENPQGEEQKNIFDRLGDLCKRMVIGIFIFIFQKLPLKIWKIISNIERLKKIFRYIHSIMRAIMWAAILFILLCLGWIVFWYQKFMIFWKSVWNWICEFCRNVLWVYFRDFLTFLRFNAGWIWMTLAICGCIYGLLYVTLKRRAKRQGKVFNGLWGWLRRRKKTGEDSQPEIPGEAAQPEKQ